MDIATSPDEVEPADVVVLHRVVCCYPDYERLLSAAASHAKRLLVYSHPPRNLLSRMMVGCENLLHRLRGNAFRAFVHPPAAMMKAAQAQGLSVSYRHRGMPWTIVGFERFAPQPRTSQDWQSGLSKNDRRSVEYSSAFVSAEMWLERGRASRSPVGNG